MGKSNKKIVQLSLYDEFDIKVSTFNNGTFPPHRHLLFEMMYVLKGTGIHMLNNERHEYVAHQLFIVTPGAGHGFEATEETTVCTISFNEVFFSPNKSYTNGEVDFSELFKKLEVIYYNLSAQQKGIMFGREKELVTCIIQQLIEENERKQMFYSVFIQNLMFLLFSLTARKLQSDNINTTVANSTSRLVLDVINYIQYHIYKRKQLPLHQLAKTFGKSKESLLRCFKSATGKTIKEFIIEYKLSLVRSRLLFSDMPVSEIAGELDFTDESHLNKMFKAKLKITPARFREVHSK